MKKRKKSKPIKVKMPTTLNEAIKLYGEETVINFIKQSLIITKKGGDYHRSETSKV